MAENRNERQQDDNDEFYEDVAETADFVHDRLHNFMEPTTLNNTVEEYAENEEGNA